MLYGSHVWDDAWETVNCLKQDWNTQLPCCHTTATASASFLLILVKQSILAAHRDDRFYYGSIVQSLQSLQYIMLSVLFSVEGNYITVLLIIS